MDLNQLRTFVAVAQEGHLTRAAERLHISQPAASAHIRALELFLGVALFTRTNRGLDLTFAGRRLAEGAERILSSTVDLLSLARELRGSLSGRVSIGSNADPVIGRMGSLVRWLREHHPRLDVNVEVRSSLATSQGLRTGELDAGFMLGSSPGSGLGGLILADLEYRVVGSADLREALNAASWKELADMPWVVTAEGTSNQQMRDEIFGPHGLVPRAVIEVNNDLMLRHLIAEGVGIGLVRRDLAEEGQAKGLFSLCPRGVGHTSLLFLHATARSSDPVLQALVTGIREIGHEVRAAPSP